MWSRNRTFAARLAALDKPAFTAFIVDVWTARGVTAIPEESAVTLSDESNRHLQRLQIVHWDSPLTYLASTPPNDPATVNADVIVSNRHHPRLEQVAAEAGVGYVGPTRLRELLRYAISTAETTEILARHFEEPVPLTDTRDTPPLNPSTILEGAIPSSFFPIRRPQRVTARRSIRTVSVLVLAILLLLTASITGFGHHTESIGPNTDTQPAVGNGTGQPQSPPAWLGPATTGNLSGLIERQERAVQQHAVRIQIRHAGSTGRTITRSHWAYGQQTILVERSGAYQVAVTGALAPAAIGTPPRPLELDIRGNRSDCSSTITAGRLHLHHADPCTPFTNESARRYVARVTDFYIERYFTGTRPTIRPRNESEGAGYLLESTRRPAGFPAHITEYRATAVIDATGVIQHITVRYNTPRGPTTGTVRFTYSLELDPSKSNHTTTKRVRPASGKPQ